MALTGSVFGLIVPKGFFLFSDNINVRFIYGRFRKTMISNNSPLRSISFAAMPRISAGGRTYVPVPRNQVLYSHFKYVSGFAESTGEKGISVDKLRILNTIIDQLVKMKTNESQKAEISKSAQAKINSEINENQIDSLLAYYHNEIKNATIQSELIGYGGVPNTAAALDLTA